MDWCNSFAHGVGVYLFLAHWPAGSWPPTVPSKRGSAAGHRVGLHSKIWLFLLCIESPGCGKHAGDHRIVLGKLKCHQTGSLKNLDALH